MTITKSSCSESSSVMQRPRQVEPEEFLRFATSNRPIVRDDDEEAGTCGLLDTDTGERFVTDSFLLMRFSIRTI